jgi:four helix bundle protein
MFAQLQRASLSVQLNLAEGWTFNRTPTWARHLGIAYGSAVEAATLLTSWSRLGLSLQTMDKLYRLTPLVASDSYSAFLRKNGR